MLDGAYGGCSIDLGDYESVLLVADDSERDGRVFGVGGLIPARVEPLFSRPGVHA